MVTAGDLNGGNAGALTAKLNGALAKLNSGKANAGTNQLNAFINQINAFVRSGKLTTTQGADLIALAEAAIASASEGGGSMLIADGDAAMTDATPLVHQDELLLATIGVSLTDAAGAVTADEQARLEDSLAELNTSFGAYGVSLVVLDDPANVDAQFNVVIADMTPCGDMADGVLGCTSGPGEITIVDGWNWYTSDDATALGVGQFDFQTVLTHELGHALGLTHSGDDLSVMHSWLSDGTAHRALTANDLALLVPHDPEEEPAALRAAPRTVPSDQLEVSAIAPMVYVSPVSDPAALTLSSGLASPAIRQTAATDLSNNYLLSPSSHGRSIASTVDVSSRLADSRAEDSVEHESWLIAIDAIFATEGESEEQSVGSEITLGL